MLSHYDVLVAGCGCAGFCAAVEAARCGKRVILIEKNDMPGGILTVGGNNDIAQFFSEGVQLIAGIGWEFCRRLEAVGGAVIPDMQAKDKPHPYYGVHVNIPLAAATMDEMLLDAGVEINYGQVLCAAQTAETPTGKRISSVLVTSKNGLREIRASVYIDCTGDGDLSVFAGANYECGEETDGTTALQPGTVRYYPSVRACDDATAARAGEALRRAMNDGILSPADMNAPDLRAVLSARGCNFNHISDTYSDDCDSRTAADIAGRQCVKRIIGVLRDAGVTDVIETVAPETALRETRRIVCDTKITAEDYVSARTYPDGVCHSYYLIDLHLSGKWSIRQQKLEKGKKPSIPLSAMTVSGIDNLLVAGRCAWGDRLANSAYRVKASCMAMGQACGAAAALASETTGNHCGNTRSIDIARLRALLAQHGCIVPPTAEDAPSEDTVKVSEFHQ
ncbi:MAG: FAD-dependent oxidoreductase [Clostridia bacterium]|nr:FAD-dependent oxidoreductase [Clostridia bacterium]